ncbi:MAG TPA: TAT-variant-translocated molybdopterin oxidoreductase [Stellaceae bacterium]
MSGDGHATVDLAALRRRLRDGRGPAYWQSLEELAETPEFLAHVEQEFPRFAAAAAGALDRRRFLQLMAASMALGGLAACGPEEKPRQMLPYVEQPPGIVPGRARYYATATTLDGYATGVMLQHQMGRPIKVEGNPDHPASLGATGAIEQATILGLYDPYRAQALTRRGRLESWSAFVTAIVEKRRQWQASHGQGLYLLTGAVTSPTLLEQIAALQQAFPELRWQQWEPLHRDAARAAAQRAFGRPVETVLDLAKANVILAVESDFLTAAPGHLSYARAFAARRRPVEVKDGMSRLYAVESTPTLTGAKADHRLIMAPDGVAAALRFIAASVGAGPRDWAQDDAPDAERLRPVAADLLAHRGRALVHAGREQPVEVQALVHAINHALGAFGQTVRAIEPVAAMPPSAAQSLAALAQDMAAGKVDTLIMLGTNPVYTAPADLDFARALAEVKLSIYLGPYADETAEQSHWHVAETHEYEAWSDARAFEGTATILQPQVRPFYEGRSAHELLALLLGDTAPDGFATIRERWQREASRRGTPDFEAFWHDALRVGVVPDTAARPVDVAIAPALQQSLATAKEGSAGGLTLLFRADSGVWDGRFAANGWLQEMPRPFTRLTWDNAAMMAPATAERLGLAEADTVDLTLGGRTLKAPVWILPGQAPDCVTLPLGYGRRRAGPVGSDVGFDAYRLRSGASPWQAAGATLNKRGERHVFAPTQRYSRVAGRDLVRSGDLADFLRDPQFLAHPAPDQSLFPEFRYDGIAWAMSISLNSCIGCQACVVACQAENNIPVVGKDQVHQGRDMHWLRIDRYYTGGLDDPEMAFQPVPCMHCEKAPCEVVCPVQATVHDSEGLNVMVYNRCVGTRFCSNNCPYKVRRFNFFSFTSRDPRPRDSWNPEVTVRDRGVMEKCTYCIQRTRTAQIDADRENRALKDGEVVTACAQACPTQAIVFGDRNDKASAVAQRKASPLDYAMLGELNTRPRTTYEAEIRNANPAFDKAKT